MLSKSDIEKIKQTVTDFFQKTTLTISSVGINCTQENGIDIVNLEIKSDEPQILIGQQGQTLFEIQRILRLLLNKKLQKIVYLNLDINDYKKKKIEYLKETAKDLANEVALSKKEKVLSPMSSYERKIIHAELSDRSDIITESCGEGMERHIVIKPK
jgi:spoIIIJ-associated protein